MVSMATEHQQRALRSKRERQEKLKPCLSS